MCLQNIFFCATNLKLLAHELSHEYNWLDTEMLIQMLALTLKVC